MRLSEQEAKERRRLSRLKWRETHKEQKRIADLSYRLANAERLSALKRQKYLANREQMLARMVRYRAENLEKFRQMDAAYRASNPEKVKAVRDAWRAKNPNAKREWDKKNMHLHCANTARRRAAETKATPAWANKFFIEEAYALAQLRTKVLGYQWHVDHIVPLRSKIVCGLHVERNLQVIPGAENLAKGNRRWPDMPTVTPAVQAVAMERKIPCPM